MNGSNGRKARQFWNGTGFYIALFLLVTAIAVAGYWTLLLPSRTVSSPAAETPGTTGTSAEGEAPVVTASPPAAPELPATEPEDEPAVPAAATGELTLPAEADAPDEEPGPGPDLDEAEVAPAVSTAAPVAPRLIVSPLVGETVAAFSADALSYNETLDDWRTHDGIDIAAAAGTHVLAACSGTVESVVQDDLLGTTVTLVHSGGYRTVYANLQQIPAVGEGEYVSAGQILGAVGATALSESALPAHLHFAVTLDGAPVDPQAFLRGE